LVAEFEHVLFQIIVEEARLELDATTGFWGTTVTAHLVGQAFMPDVNMERLTYCA
jgi:hypothetical protein